MSLSFVEHVVKNLVEHPQSVKVSMVPSDNKVVVEIKVAGSDLPRVLGQDGRVLRALRTATQVCSADKLHEIVIDVTSL